MDSITVDVAPILTDLGASVDVDRTWDLPSFAVGDEHYVLREPARVSARLTNTAYVVATWTTAQRGGSDKAVMSGPVTRELRRTTVLMPCSEATGSKSRRPPVQSSTHCITAGG